MIAKYTKSVEKLPFNLFKWKNLELFAFRGQNHLHFCGFYAKIYLVECGTLRKKAL